jgi:enediyne biosynthesis protein E4
MRAFRAVVGWGAVTALVAGVPASAHGRSQGSVTVALSPVGPVSVPQGLPFSFRAVATNPDPTPVTVPVVFHLEPAGGSTSVDALLWSAPLPAQGSVVSKFGLPSAQWFADLGTFTVTPLIAGVPAGPPLDFDVTAPTVVPPVFEDVTQAAGLDTDLPGPMCYQYGSGAAWGDVEGDGDLDLYVPLPNGSAQLWVQDSPGHFTNQAAERAVDDGGRSGMGAVFADFDHDGDQDLYVTNNGPNRLYRNDGTGHFVDVARDVGVADGGAGPSAAWGDYDNDGRLDLYVTNYASCQSTEQPDRLYHQEVDGTFTDQTALLEDTGSTRGVGYQAVWFDYDDDGDQDIYLANDKLSGSVPGNHLWRNDGMGESGTWVFTDVSDESGTGWIMASMGIGISDFDHDQDLDMVISNIHGNVLARNNGDGTFTDVAAQARAQRAWQNADLHSVTWGLGFYDFNLDGWEDLYAAAGNIYDATPQPNELFVADGRGRFVDLSATSGADDPSTSRGVAFADYDRDGRMDMYVVNQWGSPRLFHNVTPIDGAHWLEIQLAGTTSNANGCGARIEATVGSDHLLREEFCGGTSLASGADLAVHLGLGTTAVVSKLVVTWPSGVRQVVRNVAADRLVTLVEP